MLCLIPTVPAREKTKKNCQTNMFVVETLRSLAESPPSKKTNSVTISKLYKDLELVKSLLSR